MRTKSRTVLAATLTAVLSCAVSDADPIRLDRDPTSALANLPTPAAGEKPHDLAKVHREGKAAHEAHAEEHGDYGPSHPHAIQLAGAKVVALHTWKDEDGWEMETSLGLGVFYEHALVPGWLEAEISVACLRVVSGNDRGVVVPIDLLFKMPFHPNDLLEPYVGAGPAFSLERIDGETEFEAGVSTVLGMYMWFWGDWGMDVEVDYNALIDAGRVDAHEVTFAMGFVRHF